MHDNITVSFAPHISKPLSTRTVMIDVIMGLAPAMIAAGYYFRLRAFILIAACVIASAVTEWVCNVVRKKPFSLGDFSVVVTGIILALSLPPMLPVWTAVIGSVVAVAIGKMAFGGLGSNTFNPAMVGRTFLAVSFGTLMTTWTVPATIDPNMSKISAENILISDVSEFRTQATPLAWSKMAIKNNLGAETYAEAEFLGTVTGAVGGCLGETSVIALIFGGAYLLIRRTISFHIPAAVLISAVVFAAVGYWQDPMTYVQPLYHLTSGGMLLCAFFIATDPVTAPLTRRGMWIFGIGVGGLTMLIRLLGGYPEGVMFSVLLMNAVTPLIDRLCKRVPASGKPKS
ncbi:MAG: RnfABCDGE type electron transport complex subunit D [Sedimentisphaerales bacterium]|nr:RnfABCDGE type electron transport complex subunit D [Sedimentisphaerales bacterium]